MVKVLVANRVVMPRLDPEMKQGKIVNWLKKEGDRVEKGEPLADVEAEKVTFQIEAPEAGVIRKILVQDGVTVPITETIAIIASPEEDISGLLAKVEAVPPPEEAKKVVEEVVAKPPLIGVEGVKASPSARRLAQEYRVDLTKIKGTGPGGRIVTEDVMKYVEERKIVKEEVVAEERFRIIPLSDMRRTIAERLTQSHLAAPHVSLIVEVDMIEAVKLRSSIAKAQNIQISYTTFFVKAVASALKQYPLLNSSFTDEGIKVFNDVNIAVAVALPEGLITPVIRNADQMTLIDLSKKVDEVSAKAREGRLSPTDVLAGTFTVSNLGPFQMDVFSPIINPPQAGILGVGRIIEKPVVVEGQITIRKMVNLSLVFDHRVVDGAYAAQFLQLVKERLEEPYLLLA